MSEKVFFVMNRLGGPGWGGAHRVSLIIANYFARKNYDVSIIVWNDSIIDYPVDSKIKLIQLHDNITREKDRIRACLKTRKILASYKGAYVYVFMSRMAIDVYLATRFLNLKIIGSERTDPRSEPRSEIFRFVRNHLFGLLYRTVYQTPDAKAYFPKKAQINGVVIPNPISPSLPEPFEGKRNYNFVTYCRIDNQKNLTMMIDAFIDAHNHHPEYNLLIYGSGAIETDVKEYIHRNDAESYIHMKGFCSEVHSKILDAYAYLSSSDYEGLSNSMLEAMALGLPCICTDCPIGGARMVIKDGENGLLVPVGDANAMTQAINKLIENPYLCKKLSKNAAELRFELSENVICSKWESLMN